jgi:hypothetical protein
MPVSRITPRAIPKRLFHRVTMLFGNVSSSHLFTEGLTMIRNARRKQMLVATVVVIIKACCLIGCGGGGGGSATEVRVPSQVSHTIASETVGTTYSISVGLPPGYDEFQGSHDGILDTATTHGFS